MGLAEARAEIKNGRLWKARDRLDGMRMTAPYDQKLLELLGTVRADMGDLPAAGLAWFLTDGNDPRRDAAFAAMRERYGGGMSLAYRLKVRANVEDFPEPVQERLRALQHETDGRWRPARPEGHTEPERPSIVERFVPPLGCLLFAAVLVIPWVRGVAEIFD